MTCGEVRERLPEHALGTLDEAEALRVRRHLRGCAQCRREFAAIGEGLTLFAAAAHDRTPPPELRDSVLGVLAEEWRSDPVRIPDAALGRRTGWVVAAAASFALVAAVAWGVSANDRADDAAAAAGSYHNLLATLGGEEFRVGALQPAGDARVEGSVVLYDSHVEQSWGVVLVRAPELPGPISVTLSSAGGRTIELGDVKLTGGTGATWLVSPEDLRPYDHLVARSADGEIVATASIAPA